MNSFALIAGHSKKGAVLCITQVLLSTCLKTQTDRPVAMYFFILYIHYTAVLQIKNKQMGISVFGGALQTKNVILL